MPRNNKPANPHAAAAGAYGDHARKHTPDQRELEARVLLQAAQNFVALQNDWSNMKSEQLKEALAYNRRVWMMFVDNAMEDKSPDRPMSLRSNIANLGAFIFKHSSEVQAKPKKEKLNVLIDINREIAAGLMTKPGAGSQKPEIRSQKSEGKNQTSEA